MNGFRPCIVIPNYNHARGFATLAGRLLEHGLPVLVVNDGSAAATTTALEQLARDQPLIEVLRFATNRGKGAAVMAGMEEATRRGFSHVLQIDADGQHDVNDVDKFLALARRHPQAVICGCPIYDASVPAHRKLCRYFTHNLVWLQTLSFTIRDSMCGFRVYPLGAVAALLSRTSMGERMDFDIEILVRLYWNKVEIISLRTQVVYPKDGLSNYRLWADNWLIAKMHARLLGGMLLRIPDLCGRRSAPDEDLAGIARLPKQGASHWTSIAERGSGAGLKVMLWVYQHLGRWVFLLLLHPVTFYYVLAAGTARAASRQYWQQLAQFQGREPEVGFATLYAHFYAFGVAAIDKIASWTGDIKRSDVVIHGQELFDELIAARQGAVFIGSHLGNLELCRALGQKSGKFRINAVVFNKNALKFQQVLRTSAPEVELNLIHVETIGIDTAITLKQKVDAGEIVIIVGDRTAVGSTGRVHHAEFLGRKAPFAEGPFVMASLLECPVYLLFCIKERQTYNVYLERFAQTLKFPRAERNLKLAGKVQEYARRLEYHCTRAPLQWFNFFDFWQSDTPVMIDRESRER
jgi:predicted LPLAT superfamily acyltransferase